MPQLKETDVETVFADLTFVAALKPREKQSSSSKPLSAQIEELTR